MQDRTSTPIAGTGAETAAAAAEPRPDDTLEASRVLAEQLELLVQQWQRIPIVIALLAGYVAHLGHGYARAAWIVAWAGATIGALALRALLVSRVRRSGGLRVAPHRWADRFVAFTAVNGLVSGTAALLFMPALPLDRQALLTMIMCCWGVGAIAANAAYPRVYYAFAIPLFAQIGLAWLLNGLPGSGFIIVLLAAFAAILVLFVRDNGRLVVESIRLRYANQRLLDQQRDFIERLRGAYESARAAHLKAEAANRAKSQFLAAASHDLRQPLHALSLLTAVLHDIAESDSVRRVGEQLERSVTSLDRLFNALLDLSQLDAGVVSPACQSLGLDDLLGRLSTEYRSKAAEKHLRFDVTIDPGLRVRTDPILVERIVRNLLENAIRFTSSGGVGFAARRDGTSVVVEVSDTGIGIPEQEQERIFDEFYQLGNPGRDRTHGLGLGLSIVRRLARLLGHGIALKSRPGAGSTFTLTLACVVDDEPERTTGSPVAARTLPEIAGLRVLLVEDDAEARDAMSLALRGWGCEVQAADSIPTAMALLDRSAGPPDIVLADLRLGGGADGIEAVAALRARLGPIAAALITGETAAERLAEVRSAGLPVLHKPVHGDELRMLLASLRRPGRAPVQAERSGDDA